MAQSNYNAAALETVGSEAIPFDVTIWMVLGGFAAVALYNVLALNVKIFLTFKRYRGLYFWSLLACSWGIAVHVVGICLKDFTGQNPWMAAAIQDSGWICMVTGQSFVLYSRLHLVVRTQRFLLRAILWMIIIDGVLLHGSSTGLHFGIMSDAANVLMGPFRAVQKITVFTAQETLLSGIYVYYALQLMKPGDGFSRRRRINNNIKLQLVIINTIIIVIDVTLASMEFANFYVIETGLKSTIYSIKLTLEFAVLGQLMRLTKEGPGHMEDRRSQKSSGKPNKVIGGHDDGNRDALGGAGKALGLGDRWSRSVRVCMPSTSYSSQNHNGSGQQKPHRGA